MTENDFKEMKIGEYIVVNDTEPHRGCIAKVEGKNMPKQIIELKWFPKDKDDIEYWDKSYDIGHNIHRDKVTLVRDIKALKEYQRYRYNIFCHVLGLHTWKKHYLNDKQPKVQGVEEKKYRNLCKRCHRFKHEPKQKEEFTDAARRTIDEMQKDLEKQLSKEKQKEFKLKQKLIQERQKEFETTAKPILPMSGVPGSNINALYDGLRVSGTSLSGISEGLKQTGMDTNTISVGKEPKKEPITAPYEDYKTKRAREIARTEKAILDNDMEIEDWARNRYKQSLQGSDGKYMEKEMKKYIAKQIEDKINTKINKVNKRVNKMTGGIDSMLDEINTKINTKINDSDDFM